MSKQSRQTIRAERQRKQRRNRIMTIGGIALGVIVFIGLIYLAVNPSSNGTASAAGQLMGTAIPVTSREHVAENTDPGPYQTNPPTEGRHFETDYMAKFYNEGDPETTVPHPEGYLVHSMEHGYVIFWYNCQFPGIDCNALKQTIQQVMKDNGETKLIAFPWPKMDVPLALTSWGQLLKMKTPDAKVMDQFVKTNRGQAPEPDGP
jgi:hypothetical protein